MISLSATPEIKMIADVLRSIAVDGGHHGQLALKMTSALCGKNETYWKQAQEHTATALQMRIRLWDGAYEEILARRGAARTTENVLR